jgi:hypothetical protein
VNTMRFKLSPEGEEGVMLRAGVLRANATPR